MYIKSNHLIAGLVVWSLLSAMVGIKISDYYTSRIVEADMRTILLMKEEAVKKEKQEMADFFAVREDKGDKK